MIMIIVAAILSGLPLLMNILFPIKFKVINIVFIVRLSVVALAPIWAVMGAAGALLGWVSGAYWTIPMGIIGAGMATWYVWRCTWDHKGFAKAFGVDWKDQIHSEQIKHMVQKRWTWFFPGQTTCLT